MTNPVILLGTQSNGETLPVQVDATGRLVAEGLQGQQGPPGADGVGQLPPDPYEGAILGWLNNELAWIGTPPVPIPSNVFGPITEYDPSSGYLKVAGEIPETVGNGVYVYQCDETGDYFTEGCDVSQEWTNDVGAGSVQFNRSYGPDKAFNGETEVVGTQRFVISSGSPYDIDQVTTLTLRGLQQGNVVQFLGKQSPSAQTVRFNGSRVSGIFTSEGVAAQWNTLGTAVDGINTITVDPTVPNIDFYAIRVGQNLLLDRSKSLNIRVNQLYDGGIIGVPNLEIDFTVGKYLLVPEQRVAPWVLYGNDPTSLIDHLRQT